MTKLPPSQAFHHAPVLLAEVVAAAVAAAPVRILDCTVGGAGHACELLAACPAATLVGLDRDPVALAAASERLAPFAGRATLVQATFADYAEALAAAWGNAEHAGQAPFDFVVADFGVSSVQLDRGERGFSFQVDAPLDMRMGPSGETAAELIARLEAPALADILYGLAEERLSRPIARALVEERPTTTLALANTVRRIKRRHGGDGGKADLATKVFMALRMAVNDELGQIARLLAALPAIASPAARLAAISFHSGEDRLIKRLSSPLRTPCTCSPIATHCTCQAPRSWAAVGRGCIVASAAELANNPRARSAKLRVLERHTARA